MRLSGILLLLCLFGPLSYAQVEEQVDVGVLEIWVKVTDKEGKAISDLTSEDFKLQIDGQPAELRCFDKSFEDAVSVSNPDQGRKFVFFFDLLNTLPGDMEFLKNSVTRFILDSFRENDQGMVFALLPTANLGVVQKMTSNRQALVMVVRKMRGNMSLSASIDSNEKQLLDVLYPLDTTSDGANPLAGRGVGTRPVQNFHAAQSLARNFAAQEENRSRLTLNTFTSIARHLSETQIQGHVALLYISGGFPINPGEQYFEMVQQLIEEQFAAGSGDLAMIDRPNFNFQYDIRRTIGALNRMNVTIYSMDAKGLLMNARGAEMDSVQAARGLKTFSRNLQLQDSLVLVARETGGLSFTNGQDYRKGLADIVRDMNEQYLLCADLSGSKKKDGYHEIEVKVARPGVRVRHRKGYVD